MTATRPDGSAPSGRQHEIAYGRLRAVVTEVGATLRVLQSAGTDIVDGFDVDAMCAGGRGQVLAPWPNRLADGRYRFEGTAATAALDEPERANAIHGLVRWMGWELLGSAQNVVTLGCVLQPQPAYPWRLRMIVEYRLTRSGLVVTTTASTDAAAGAPFGLGFHPYLSLGTQSVDGLRLRIPASQRLRTDERGLPVGVADVAGTAFDFRHGRVLGTIALDTAFTGLVRDPDGRARVTLERADGRGGAAVWGDEAFTHFMVYTGDTLPDAARRRAAVAVEPMTCPPNALRTGVDVARVTPSAPWRGQWGIELD